MNKLFKNIKLSYKTKLNNIKKKLVSKETEYTAYKPTIPNAQCYTCWTEEDGWSEEMFLPGDGQNRRSEMEGYVDLGDWGDVKILSPWEREDFVGYEYCFSADAKSLLLDGAEGYGLPRETWATGWFTVWFNSPSIDPTMEGWTDEDVEEKIARGEIEAIPWAMWDFEIDYNGE